MGYIIDLPEEYYLKHDIHTVVHKIMPTIKFWMAIDGEINEYRIDSEPVEVLPDEIYRYDAIRVDDVDESIDVYLTINNSVDMKFSCDSCAVFCIGFTKQECRARVKKILIQNIKELKEELEAVESDLELYSRGE